MSTELLFTKKGADGVAAKIDLKHGVMAADDYPKLYAQFLRAAGVRKADFVEMHTLYPDQRDCDVWWSEALCPDGVRLTLMVMPGVDDVTLKLVRARLKRRFDVVSFKTLRIDRFVEFQPKLTCIESPTQHTAG